MASYFPDDFFKYIFLKKNVGISIKIHRNLFLSFEQCFFINITLKFIPKFPIGPALAQRMAWRRAGDKPLSEPMKVSYWRIYASLGLSEF